MAVVRGGDERRLLRRQRRGVAARPAIRRPRTRRSLRRRTSAPRRRDPAARASATSARAPRAVDVGVAVHHAEPHELRVLESRNEPEHARLLGPFELRLESHEAEMVAGEIVLAQLHRRVRHDGRCADRRVRPASSDRSAACRVRDAPSPRSADSPRRIAPCRSRERSPTPRGRARHRTARTRRASAGNSNNRPAHRRARRRARGSARPSVSVATCSGVCAVVHR